MLKPEDCKPGVEVIAIKNKICSDIDKPPLSIGMIYTIKKFGRFRYEYDAAVSLIEIENNDTNLPDWGYWLDQFKLKPNFREMFNIDKVEKSKALEIA